MTLDLQSGHDAPPGGLVSCGMAIDDDGSFGLLRSSTPLLSNPEALRSRMQSDGYLFLPDLLDRDTVLRVRRHLVDELADGGYLSDERPADDAVLAPDSGYAAEKFGERAFGREKPSALAHLLTEGALPAFFESFLGALVRNLDRTIMRARAGDQWSATYPHCDSVFMGRGTKELFTTWIPLGDVPAAMGGLMVLEKSHHVERLRHEYSDRDVDEYCANHPDAADFIAGVARWDGKLSDDPVRTQREWGGRWLTSPYRAGDVVVFSIYTVHGSTDNLTDRIRLSVDTRFQRAAEPADDRWVGDQGEGRRFSPRGRIC